MSSPDHIVAIIDKDQSAQVRIELTEWRGRSRVELREFSPGPISGTWWPSGKAVSLDIAKLPELLDGIRNAEAEARRRGLLSDDGRAA